MGKPKQSSEVYTQTAIDVRTAALALWAAVMTAGAPAPPLEGATPEEWLPQDRNRALVRAYAAGFPTPEVRAAVRAYDRAFNRCIKTNMGMVYKVAGKLLRKGRLKGLEQEDLNQEGVLGMQRALETFDPSKKVAFSTYSYFWIYQTIDRSINNSGTIRIPIKTQDLAMHGKKSGHLADRAREAARVVSLDAPLHASHCPEVEITLFDIVACIQPSPEDNLREKQDHEALYKVLSFLSEKELTVLHGRYMEDKTLEEVGETLNLTRERIRQIEAAALEKIRTHVERGRVGFNG